MEIVMGTGPREAPRLPRFGGRTRGALCTLAAFTAAILLSGCVELDRELAPPPVNPSSSIASYAERIAEAPLATPSLTSVPPKVTDAPTPETFKGAVVGQIAVRRDLEAWWALHPPMTDDTEAFAQAARGRIPKGQAIPVPQTHDAESEAFAKRLRDAAVKP